MRKVGRAVTMVSLGCLVAACGGGSTRSAQTFVCPTKLHRGATVTVSSVFDPPRIAIGRSRVVVVTRTKGADVNGWAYQMIDLPSGRTRASQVLTGIADDTEIYDMSVGSSGTALVTDTMDGNDDGHRILVTFLDPRGNIAWQRKVADGGVGRSDDFNSERLAVQVVGQVAYVDTDAGVQALAIKDGSRHASPTFIGSRALLPRSQVSDLLVLASEHAVTHSSSDDGARADIVSESGAKVGQFLHGLSQVGTDGSVLSAARGDLLLSPPGQRGEAVPPPVGDKSWDDVEGLVSTCGDYLYLIDNTRLGVYQAPKREAVSSLALGADVDTSDAALTATARAVLLVSSSEQGDTRTARVTVFPG